MFCLFACKYPVHLCMSVCLHQVAVKCDGRIGKKLSLHSIDWCLARFFLTVLASLANSHIGTMSTQCGSDKSVDVTCIPFI